MRLWHSGRSGDLRAGLRQSGGYLFPSFPSTYVLGYLLSSLRDFGSVRTLCLCVSVVDVGFALAGRGALRAPD